MKTYDEAFETLQNQHAAGFAKFEAIIKQVGQDERVMHLAGAYLEGSREHDDGLEETLHRLIYGMFVAGVKVGIEMERNELEGEK